MWRRKRREEFLISLATFTQNTDCEDDNWNDHLAPHNLCLSPEQKSRSRYSVSISTRHYFFFKWRNCGKRDHFNFSFFCTGQESGSLAIAHSWPRCWLRLNLGKTGEEHSKSEIVEWMGKKRVIIFSTLFLPKNRYIPGNISVTLQSDDWCFDLLNDQTTLFIQATPATWYYFVHCGMRKIIHLNFNWRKGGQDAQNPIDHIDKN